ncbi:MAG: hypothetical protein K0R50_3144 [Eubacterium sp.]|jgi:hypothetical protein|nr:hypothetical protein [Eubacterium sp.]
MIVNVAYYFPLFDLENRLLMPFELLHQNNIINMKIKLYFPPLNYFL